MRSVKFEPSLKENRSLSRWFRDVVTEFLPMLYRIKGRSSVTSIDERRRRDGTDLVTVESENTRNDKFALFLAGQSKSIE